MNIRLRQKRAFLKLLMNQRKNQKKLFTDLHNYNEQTLSPPCKFERTSLKYALGQNEITINLLTGIIHLFIRNWSNLLDQFEYSLEDFQKLFVHFDKNQLKGLGDLTRENYNNLINKLTEDREDFKNVFLNEDWEVDGDNTVDIEPYEELIFRPEKRSSKKKGSLINQTLSLMKRFKWQFFVILSVVFIVLSYLYLPLVILAVGVQFIGVFDTLKSSIDQKILFFRLSIFAVPILFLMASFLFFPTDGQRDFLYPNPDTNYTLNTLSNYSGILTIENHSTTEFKILFGIYEETEANIGDTIVLTTFINRIRGSELENIKVVNFGRKFQKDDKHTFLAGVIGPNGEEIYDVASLIIDNDVRLRNLNMGNVIHMNKKDTIINSLSQTQEKAIVDGGLVLESVRKGKDAFTVVNSYYVVESSGKLKAGFDPNPAEAGIGFVTINHGSGSANERDLIQAPSLKPGEKFNFQIYLDFHNWGSFDIQNAKAIIEGWVSYPKLNSAVFSASLKGDNVKSISDETEIVGLPEDFEIKLEKTLHLNTHATTTKDKCSGYGIRRWVSDNELDEGVDLDVLDTNNKGWCDQGYVIYYYTLTNTKG